MDRSDSKASGGKIVDLPRVRGHAEDAERAPRRGVYEAPDGARRVVGGGDVIPDGWTLVDDTPVVDRADGTPTAQEILNSPRGDAPVVETAAGDTGGLSDDDQAALDALSDEDRDAVVDLLDNHTEDDVRGWARDAGAPDDATPVAAGIAVLGAWQSRQAEIDEKAKADAAAQAEADAKAQAEADAKAQAEADKAAAAKARRAAKAGS